MNFGIKTATFLAANQTNTTPLRTMIGENGRLLGIMCIEGTPFGLAGACTAALWMVINGVTVPLLTCDATAVNTKRTKWLGLSGQYEEDSMSTAAAAANDTTGFFPIAPPCKWNDSVYTAIPVELTLGITSAGAGAVVLFYTEDPPIPQGEQA